MRLKKCRVDVAFLKSTEIQHLLHPLRVWIDCSHWFALWFDMHVLQVIRKTNKTKLRLQQKTQPLCSRPSLNTVSAIRQRTWTGCQRFPR